MGFAAPLALVGLLALAGPVVAHLLRQQRLRTRTLPTVALLERARAESERRLRLADPWLLALRILGLGALLLALAEPFVTSERAFSDGRRASLAIVLDDSLSMAQTTGSGTAFEDARERAARAIEALGEGSEVAIVLAGDAPRLLVPRTKDLEGALLALRGLEGPGARGTALEEAVRLGQRALSGAPERRRLWLLSDFAGSATVRGSWPPQGIAGAAERVGPETRPENVALVDVLAAPDPTRPGATSVRLVGRGAPGTYPARLERRGETLAEGELEILAAGTEAPGELGRGELTLAVDTPALDADPGLRAVLDAGDALPADDARGVLLRPPAAVRLLLVDGDPHPDRRTDEVGFLTRALEVAPTRTGHRVIDRGAFRPGELGDVDVVVWANAGAPGAAGARALDRFVRAGGGLLVATGDRSPPRALRARLGELLPGVPGPRVEEIVALRGERPGLTELAGAEARRRLPLEPKPGTETWLRAGDGPALLVGSHGDGVVALLGVSLDLGDSNLPLQPGFVPLVDTLLGTLAGSRAPPGDVRAGASVSREEIGGALRVERPDGTRRWVEDEAFTDTELGGVYRVLEEDDTVRSAFVVAPPPGESDLTPGAPPSSASDAGDELPANERQRRPLAGLAFLVAGLALGLEGWLRVRRRPARA
ncbi:MAG: BatA and WFA domain-containing protein [Myxococcota bacterium]